MFLSGVLNNDNLAVVVGALATFLAIWFVSRRPGSTRVRLAWAAGAGVLLGAALLTKVTAIVIGPGLALAVLLVVRGVRDRLVLFAAIAIAGVFVSGWWLVRNQVLYGDPVGNAASVTHLETIMPKLFDLGSPVVRALVTIPTGVWTSAWYTFRLESVRAGLPWRTCRFGFCSASVWSARSSDDRPIPATRWRSSSSSRCGGAAAIWIVGLQTTQVQARIGFVALSAIAGLAALG